MTLNEQEYYNESRVIQLRGELGKPNSRHLLCHIAQEDGDQIVYIEDTEIGPKGGVTTHMIEMIREHFEVMYQFVQEKGDQHE